VVKPPDAIENTLGSPGGATDRSWSVAPPGLGIDLYSIPVVTLRSATG